MPRKWTGNGDDEDRNLPVNCPKLLGAFQNVFFLIFFDVYVIGMSFYITSDTKKSDIIFLNCVLEQFNAVEST